MSRIAAVIVTYRRKEKLRNCIEALLRQSCGAPEIFVIDNNSADGTREAAEEYDVKYYNTGYNSGGAGGFCYGIRKAAEAGCDHVWLMDDDCVPADNALEEFLKASQQLSDADGHPQYGFLSGKVLWRDGSPCVMNIPRETVTRNLRDWDKDVIPVEMASFVSLFMPVSVACDVGLPIREFFIWTDDWEYTRRISRKYPCYLVTSSRALHDTAQNAGADIASAPDEKTDRFRYLYRNDVYLYRREGLKGFCYEAVRLPVHCLRIAKSGMKPKEKLRRIGILVSGTAEGLRFFPVPDRLQK